VAKIGEENYRNTLLVVNNDYNNSMQSIEIIYLHVSHFDLKVNYNNESGTIGEWFSNSPFIIDVQPSNRSEEIGKSVIIVQDNQVALACAKSPPCSMFSRPTLTPMAITFLDSHALLMVHCPMEPQNAPQNRSPRSLPRSNQNPHPTPKPTRSLHGHLVTTNVFLTDRVLEIPLAPE
jgi:hypothetical protein